MNINSLRSATSRWIAVLAMAGMFVISVNEASVYAAEADQAPIVTRVVNNWISIAQMQFGRRQYDQAENSLLRARHYHGRLNDRQRENIKNLQAIIAAAKSQKERLGSVVNKAESLVDEGRFLDAKALLENAINSGLLNETELNRVTLMNEHLNAKLEEQKRLMADLYNRSKKNFDKGQFVEAENGFTIVADSGLHTPFWGMSAEQYVEKIRSMESGQIEAVVQEKQEPSPDEILPEPDSDETMEVTVPMPDEPVGNVPEPVTQKKYNIKETYLNVLLRDTETRAAKHVGRAEFNLAKNIVKNAYETVLSYQVKVDEPFYQQCQQRLEDVSRMIMTQQQQWDKRWDTKVSGL